MLDLSEWPLAAKGALGAVVAAVLLALWSVLASTLLLACLGMMEHHHGVPFTEWWLYWLWFSRILRAA